MLVPKEGISNYLLFHQKLLWKKGRKIFLHRLDAPRRLDVKQRQRRKRILEVKSTLSKSQRVTKKKNMLHSKWNPGWFPWRILIPWLFFWPHITGNSNPTTCLFIAQFTPLSPFTSWLWLKPCDISTKRLASLFLQESAEFTRKIESRRFPKTRRFGVSFPWSSLKLTPSLLEGSSKDQPTQAISRVNSTNHVAFKTKQPCIISAASLFSVCLFGVFVFFWTSKKWKIHIDSSSYISWNTTTLD